MIVSKWRAIVAALVFAGCTAEATQQAEKKVASAPRVAQPPASSRPAPKPRPVEALPATPVVVQEAASEPRRALADLAEAAEQRQFALPELSAERIAAAGIRQLTGQHIVLYTDLPAATAVDELPTVLDAAVPKWCEYFGTDPAKVIDWKLIGSIMRDKDRFVSAGLYPESLPDFPHGYNVGSQIWIYDQPSDYFQRHLLLHEGTHAFMLRWLGGSGPPWYSEGIAELLGTHRWSVGQLELGITPANRDEVPYWGRVKIVKDDFAAGRSLSLIEVMRYDAQAHLRVEAYGWCWAAAAFLDAHPLTQAAFRELKSRTRDRTLEFSKQFYAAVKNEWPAIVEDWQIFVANCDYGYDFARAAVLRKPATQLPAAGAAFTLQTDRGWQSTGYQLAAGKTYVVKASGRYQLATSPQSWPCEAGGVTIQYVGGQPRGMLLSALSDLAGEAPAFTPLAKPQPIGLAAELTPERTGTLYLRINEPASGLADNVGTLSIVVQEHVKGPRNKPEP